MRGLHYFEFSSNECRQKMLFSNHISSYVSLFLATVTTMSAEPPPLRFQRLGRVQKITMQSSQDEPS